ncbi:Hypothetical predicted protein [Podarcis lilfordi]|uniref:Uncharacterized protein n=1 Tax=Podarcis lilfordi TaxID=74358 RepID=A0AA35JVT8_9SAUR|nr:Hypothetical predicted protein [Podarcis lilfordi]
MDWQPHRGTGITLTPAADHGCPAPYGLHGTECGRVRQKKGDIKPVLMLSLRHAN